MYVTIIYVHIHFYLRELHNTFEALNVYIILKKSMFHLQFLQFLRQVTLNLFIFI